MKANEVCVLAALRTPFGKFMGGLKDIPATSIAARLLTAIYLNLNRQRLLLDIGEIGGVYMGQVLTAGAGQNPARQAALLAGLPYSCSAETFNKVCASSLAAIRHAANAIRLGEASFMIAGGMENMSQAPYLLPRPAKTVRDQRMSEFIADNIWWREILLSDSILFDGLRDMYRAGMPHMGVLADRCAKVNHISREAQEAYSVESHLRALKAQRDNSFYRQIVPVSTDAWTMIIDEGVREPDLVKMQTLSTAFTADGTVTAATSSQISDGAAALLLSSAAAAKKCGIRPLAKISAFAVHSHEPEWYTTAPVGAIKKVLKQAGIALKDIDLFEINEAFAVVPLYAMRELNIPHSKVNIWGGAIAIGHPIGASGARITVTLVHQLIQTKKRYGVAVACNGGGEAVAVLVENLTLSEMRCNMPALVIRS